jgi:hypothetical protein
MEKILIDRKSFLKIASSTAIIIASTNHLLGENTDEIKNSKTNKFNFPPLNGDEIEILHLASLAPSGHNAQPWFVKYIKPYNYIICNDKTRWLTAVDPTQRETILSIGTFLQNLENAASNFGYACEFKLLAVNNQEENVMEVKLISSNKIVKFDIQKIIERRIVRTNYLSVALDNEDVIYLLQDETNHFHFYPNTSKEHQWLNEQTIEANILQSNRDDAQTELSNWIRFSHKDAEQHLDGLTPASMEIKGVAAFILRNFYGKENVMKKDFRDKNIENVKTQVTESAGWIIITSADTSVNSLIETGKRMERLLLKIRERNIAIHPMTQILEEPSTNKLINNALEIKLPIQFILRIGYLKKYPEPVSFRRTVESFTKI